MDENDKRILNILQEDVKVSYKEIADKLGLAASTIHARVKKMEKNGVIKNCSAIIDFKKVGYNTIAWIGLSVDPTKMNEVAEQLSNFEEIQVVAVSTGDHDVVAQIIAEDDKKLWKFINENIKTIDGVLSKMDVSSFIDINKYKSWWIPLKK
ncbi:MAG: winged helix-turn-helix transcriptional regulator [Candidatus Lokiarchaeota archaeon]|nr:winged helix-turn-helix transcriptional regulator [Candidatus Lokiarchaeota archaeon]MBD3343373.1 winged helix-turn-helix transcriptional regulator [Candidatus Lokiarchaeota archaeon]